MKTAVMVGKEGFCWGGEMCSECELGIGDAQKEVGVRSSPRINS